MGKRGWNNGNAQDRNEWLSRIKLHNADLTYRSKVWKRQRKVRRVF